MPTLNEKSEKHAYKRIYRNIHIHILICGIEYKRIYIFPPNIFTTILHCKLTIRVHDGRENASVDLQHDGDWVPALGPPPDASIASTGVLTIF